MTTPTGPRGPRGSRAIGIFLTVTTIVAILLSAYIDFTIINALGGIK